uniref:Protein tyrosine phosphatase receptor type Q n=1 Tax=Paramormyrops kingsleyae TaxID=1676925 RepID=A0A3B3RK16_9TELE
MIFYISFFPQKNVYNQWKQEKEIMPPNKNILLAVKICDKYFLSAVTPSDKLMLLIVILVLSEMFCIHPERKLRVCFSPKWNCHHVFIPAMCLCVSEVLGPPTNLEGERVGSTGILLSWTPPSTSNGQILSYAIKYKEVCPYPESTFTQTLTNSEIPEFLLNTLTPGSTYNIKVAAEDRRGIGIFSKSLYMKTAEAPPGLVTNLSAFAQNHSFVKVTWYLPKHTNGLITKFSVKAKHARTGQTVRTLEINAEDIMTGAIPHCNDAAEILSRGTPSPLDTSMLTSASLPLITLSAAPPAASWMVPISVGMDQLRPYTAYVFEVSAFTSDGEGQIASYMVRMPESAPEDPPQNLSVWNITSKSFSVSWDPPTIITGRFSYVLELHGPAGFMFENSTIDMKLSYSGLTPYTNYRLVIRAKSAGALGPEAVTTVLTPAEAPSAVNDLTTTAIDSTSVKLSWRSPSHPNGLITQYKILVLIQDTVVQNITLTGRENVEVLTSAMIRLFIKVSIKLLIYRQSTVMVPTVEVIDMSADPISYVVQNLSPFTEYTFTVSAFTTVGEGPVVEIVAKTREQVPSSVQSISCQNVSTTSILVSWEPPLYPNGKITHYTVYGLDLSNQESFKWVTNETSIILTELKKYTRYKLRVAASTAVGESSLSEEDDVFAVTMEDEPESPPVNLAVYNTTSSTAVVTWWPPEAPNGIITLYKIFFWNSTLGAVVNSTSPNVTLRGLKPFSFYNVSVRAYTKYGHGNQTSAVLEILTAEDVPGSPPFNLTYESINSTEVLVSWQPPLLANGIILFYTVEYWNSTHNLNLSTPGTAVRLSNLRKFARYRVMIQANTRLGSGNQTSEILNITTLEDVPSSPPRFLFARRLSDDQVELSWTPPLEVNSEILYYLVRVWNLTFEYIQNVTVTSLVVTVEDGGQYNASVSAWTRLGNGGILVFVMFTASDTGPADPPQNISSVSLTSSSVQVTWLPPSQPNGLILFYTVYYSNSSGVYIQLSEGPLSIAIGSLAKGSNYSLWLTSSTAQGDGGVLSDIIYVQTPEDVPDGPIHNLTALNFSSTAIIVSWDPPVSPNGRVFYHLTLKEARDASGNRTDKTTSDTVFLFTKLKKYTDYVLTVTPATSAGHSENSTTLLHLRTDDDSELIAIVLQCRNITSSSIHLSWLPPAEPNGIITGYSLVVQGQEGSTSSSTSNSTMTLTGLMPFSPYNVSLAAVTRRGTGPILTLLLHTDETGPASPPRNLSILNHTADSVWLAWEPSPDPNGMVQFYGFKIMELNRHIYTYWNSSGPATRAHLTGFRPHSTYQISVCTFTRVGNGDQYSGPVTFKTNESVSGPVGNLSCSGLKWDSVLLQWELPVDPNGEITHYRIQFSEQEQELNASVNHHSIGGLLADSQHTFSVTAVNSVGPGEHAICTTSTPPEKVPGPPRLLNVTEVQATEVSLSWFPPEEVLGYLREYLIVVQLLSQSCQDWTSPGCLESQNEEHISGTRSILQYTLKSLFKYRSYRFRVSACTNAGYGNASDWVYARTLAGDPDAPPRAVSVLPASNSLNIQWKAPEVLSGPTSYLVDVVPIRAVVVSNLTAFTRYAVTVTAFTGDVRDARMNGKASEAVHVRTLENEPKDPPKNITLHLIPEEVTRVRVTFSPPDVPNGRIIGYSAMVYTGDELAFHIQQLPVHQYENGTIAAIIDGLKGGYSYHIQISAINRAGTGPSSEVKVTTGIQPPPKPNKRPLPALTPSGAIMVTTRTITIQMPICFFSDAHGPIQKVQVIVAENGVMNEHNVTNWKNAFYYKPAPYITDEGFLNPNCHDIMSRNAAQEDTYVIGKEDGCASPEKDQAFCNGPLKPRTHYVFKFRATNMKGQYTDSEYSDRIKTSGKETLEIILGVLLSLLLVFFLIVIIYAFVRIHQKQKEGGTYSPRDAEIIDTKLKLDQLIAVADLELKEEKLNRPISKKTFLQHVEDLCTNDNAKFQEEFAELPKVLPDLATADADLPWNRSKNRFTNIKPYNNNRVKLLSEPGIPGSDYINASFVSGYLCPNEFIATQGPLPGTVGDFWRMVWETRTRTIAMLTQCFEKGRIRCHQYWPEDNKPVTVFGDIVITKLAEDVFPDWTVRVLKVERHGDYMVVNHFNFTSWPEHGVPESSATLIQFVKSIRANRGRDNSNIVVHCSAGVGRTGVFIALDHLVQHVRDHDFVDVYGLVAELRSERMCMVQNLAQYMFLHQSTLDLLSSKGNSQSIWFVSYSALEKMDSLDAMEGDVELEWEETTM